MENEELKNILWYCYKLSRLVSPRDAQGSGLIGHGGEVCDFLKDLANSYENGTPLDIKNDEFYSSVYSSMKESVGE